MARTVGTRILERSIIKHLEKSAGVGVGNDYSVLGDGSTVLAMGFADEGYDMSALSGKEKLSTGEMALVRALNNLACSGAAPKEMTISIQAGSNCPEQLLRDEMLILSTAAKKRGIKIIGGNTVYGDDGDSYNVTLTVYGSLDKGAAEIDKKPKPGDLVFVIGNVGHLGASMLAIKNKDKILERLPETYIQSALMDVDDMEIRDAADMLFGVGAYYIHDITFGGVYRALLETSMHFGMGIDVIHEKLPIRQDTIEICEVLGMNPYEITGTGGVVGVCHEDRAAQLEEALKGSGIPYSFAGKLTVEKKRVVRFEINPMERSITFYE